jgi:hypothetical protein
MNLLELKIKAEKMSREIRTEYGDHGSCILGYKLLVDGVQFISQPAQGSSTCEVVYSAVKKMLLENGVSQDRISIDYGRMD